MMAEIIPPVASNMARAWQSMASLIDSIAARGCIAHDGPDCVCDAPDADLDKEFQTKDYATPPSDFIDGAPDHYHINGENDSCPNEECRYGHHPLCELWNDPAWEHKTSLCLMTRVQCTHRTKHRYGQKCSNYLDPQDVDAEVDAAFGDVLQGKKPARLAVVPVQMTPSEGLLYHGRKAAEGFAAGMVQAAHAFAHTAECLDQGKHLSGDCDKPRPTCPHDPQHKYGEECPK